MAQEPTPILVHDTHAPEGLARHSRNAVVLSQALVHERVVGREQLHDAPVFLDDVVGRYYDFQRVVVDLIANFYKEQRPELVPDLIALANDFFASEAADLEIAPITLQEVEAYYREDAFIWRLYQGARRLDRWLHTAILRKPYPYILPGPVTR